MKEAAGEANMTVITIVLIAAVVAIATPIITSMMKGAGKQSCCQNYGGTWKNGACVNQSGGTINASTYWNSSTGKCTFE